MLSEAVCGDLASTQVIEDAGYLEVVLPQAASGRMSREKLAGLRFLWVQAACHMIVKEGRLAIAGLHSLIEVDHGQRDYVVEALFTRLVRRVSL